MKCIRIYRLFELILPRFNVESEEIDPVHLELQRKALDNILEKWIDEKVYFEYSNSANARIQLKELKYYLKHYRDFVETKNRELRSTHVPKIDFLPSVLLAEKLGILKLKSFTYFHTEDKEINKNTFSEQDVYMHFIVDILNLEIKLPEEKDESIPVIYDKNWEIQAYKTKNGNLLETRFDSNNILQGVSLNNTPLLVQKNSLRQIDLKVLAELVTKKGRTAPNEILKEYLEIKTNAELDRIFNRLREVGISIKTKRGVGRFLN